jgi:hypothetical protein
MAALAAIGRNAVKLSRALYFFSGIFHRPQIPAKEIQSHDQLLRAIIPHVEISSGIVSGECLRSFSSNGIL